MLSPAFLPLRLACSNNNWLWPVDEKLEDALQDSIKVTTKDAMYLYNYGDKVLVPRNHPVLVRCRGLVIGKDGRILNYPFDRFFNAWEKEASLINWDGCNVQEKLDGSLISVFWNGTDFEITTRGSFYPNPDSKFKAQAFDMWARTYIQDKCWDVDGFDIDYCYMFELVSPDNRIVTEYLPGDMGLYLIGMRDLRSLKEVTQKDLDIHARILGFKRPQLYDAKNLEQCKDMFLKFAPDEEGFVIVDEQFNRLKLKQESYLKLSKIKQLSPQDILDFVMGQTTIDNEYLERLPEVKLEVEKVRNHYNRIMNDAKNTYNKILEPYQTKHPDGVISVNLWEVPRKAFALEAIKYPYKNILFAILDGRIVNKLNWDIIKEW